MIAFILRKSDFKTESQHAVIDYDVIIASTGAETGSIQVLGKIGTEHVGGWLVLGKNIWLISKIEPGEKESKLTLAPPLEAFERPIHLGESAASAGAFLAAELTANFKSISDTAYAMPYLEIINNASGISYIAPQTDENGFYNLTAFMRLLEAEFGLEIKFRVETKKLYIELGVRPATEKTVFFGTAEAQLLSQTFTNQATAKVTVIKDGVSTDFYLSASGEISETPPAERAAGGWEVVTAKGKDETAEEVARSVFYKNIASHKIEFVSTRKFELYQKIRTNINGLPLQTNICFVGKNKKDKRYKYKCGELATTLTEKLGSLKTAANSAAGFNFDAAFRDKLEKTIFRVGRYWISDDPTEPSEILGFGTWERFKDKHLLGAGDTFAPGTTGGSATHKHGTQGHILIVSEMPAHNHPVSGGYSNNPFYVRYQENFGYGSYGGPTPNRLHVTNTVQTEGGNQPHDHGDTTEESNMGPYEAVYIWRRIA